ncbi:2OG-Fe dioxygenase family protein [Ramlibacter sp.]|uniref:2OG-Fe dioxygenase family protein n=1 Tax=Ramlibacter sp. TaxID=1917967 RepID=UPI002C23E8C8|nr:2OG-Fe dioxygenase family protein [Ramlibacter sp.]HWI83818.1 2OG-Fe dioxygenase family protein [Ramlibacter sp.]
MMQVSPEYTDVAQLACVLGARGYAIVSPGGVAQLTGCRPDELDALLPAWESLPLDTYLRDGGKYRRRRHSCFLVGDGEVVQAPHRAHWQPVEYNALHGGLRRWFEPMLVAEDTRPGWSRILLGLGGVFSQLRAARPWYVEAHQFRIETTGGIGRPTPEGAHRDGVSFVGVFLLARRDIKGGETRVFDAHGSGGQRFTLQEPWSLLLLDDERVIHETTPIQPAGPAGHRDTLVLTYREGGFQGG